MGHYLFVVQVKPRVQANAPQLLAWSRGHWGIESHHWIRGVAWGEADCRVRKGKAVRILSLYSTECRRRTGFSSTSGSGEDPKEGSPESRPPGSGASLPRYCSARSGADPGGQAKPATSVVSRTRSLLAPYSNKRQGECLTHIGPEEIRAPLMPSWLAPVWNLDAARTL
jgi:hypothetical protein